MGVTTIRPAGRAFSDSESALDDPGTAGAPAANATGDEGLAVCRHRMIVFQNGEIDNRTVVIDNF